MQIPKGTVIAVVDGETFRLFRNGGDENNLQLSALPEPDVGSNNRSAGARHQSSSANPDDGQQDEDTFVAGVAEKLNKQVLSGKIESLVVIAAPRSLGELRKHYHKSLSAVLVGEINKDLTGHSLQDIEKAIHAQ